MEKKKGQESSFSCLWYTKRSCGGSGNNGSLFRSEEFYPGLLSLLSKINKLVFVHNVNMKNEFSKNQAF